MRYGYGVLKDHLGRGLYLGTWHQDMFRGEGNQYEYLANNTIKLTKGIFDKGTLFKQLESKTITTA